MTEEFRAVVMDDLFGMGIASKPIIFKELFHFCSGRWAMKAQDFDKVSNWVDAGKGIKLDGFVVREGNLPRADAINMDFTPWDDGRIPRGKVSIGLVGGTDHWGYRAAGNDGATGVPDFGVIEGTFDECFQTVHARGMGESLVVPMDKWSKNIGRESNLPIRG